MSPPSTSLKQRFVISGWVDEKHWFRGPHKVLHSRRFGDAGEHGRWPATSRDRGFRAPCSARCCRVVVCFVPPSPALQSRVSAVWGMRLPWLQWVAVRNPLRDFPRGCASACKQQAGSIDVAPKMLIGCNHGLDLGAVSLARASSASLSGEGRSVTVNATLAMSAVRSSLTLK